VGVRQYREGGRGGGADSMLQFQLERGGDVMKHYRKMKWRQQVCLGSM
jgi:hypothetical protein